MWAMCLKRVLLCSGPVQTCRSAVSHVHPCFSLHPNINVLHYRINASRVANYERFLFKRLFRLPPMSVLTVLLNLHQRKSKCPCHHDGGRKKLPQSKQPGPGGQWRIKEEFRTGRGKFLFRLLSRLMLTGRIRERRKTLYLWSISDKLAL